MKFGLAVGMSLLAVGLLCAEDEPAASPDTAAPAATADENPSPAKPEQDQPTGDKPADDKPADDKPADDKPAADRPTEDQSPEKKANPPAEPEGPSDTTPPWIKVTPKIGGAAKEIKSAKDELAVFGVGDTDWERAADGVPWTGQDDELLLKILFRFPRFGRGSVEDWRKPGIPWATVVEKSGEFRGDIFPVRGRIKKIEKIALPAELVERFEFDHYFRLHFELAEGEPAADVFVREIAPAWKGKTEVDFPAVVDAVYVKQSGDVDGRRTLYLAGQRAEWLPEAPLEEAGIFPMHVLLARHGFDAGLVGDLKSTDRLPFALFDQEPFYQALKALGKVAPAEMKATDDFTGLDLPQLFASPNEHRLRGVKLHGNLRRVVKVRVSDEDLRKRFGRDHYYQLDFFLPLGNRPVVLGKDTPDGKAPVFHNEFPATLCVLELPAGIKEGQDVRAEIAADALFYRIWSYSSGYVARSNPKEKQQSPMFLARTIQIIPPPKLEVSSLDMIVLGGLIAALSLFGVVVFFLSRLSPKQAAEQRGQHLPDRIDMPS